MATDDYDLQTGQQGGGRYRLTAPNYRAFDPTQMELLTGAQVQSGPNSAEALGYNLQARGAARRGQQQYADLLRENNMQQAALADRQMGAEVLRAAMNARNPGILPLLRAGQGQMQPGSEGAWGSLASSAVAGERGIANEHQAHANQMNVEAGVMPPMGTATDEYGYMTGLRQGVPLKLQVAQTEAAGRAAGAGTERLSALTGVANLYARRAEFYAQQVNRIENSLLLQSGGRSDGNGNVYAGPNMPLAQQQEIRSRAEREAAAATDRAFGMIDHIITAGGRGGLVPPRLPTAPAPAPVTGGSGGGTGGTVPAPQQPPPLSGGAVSTPPGQQQPRPSPNQMTPQMQQQIIARRPPGAASYGVSNNGTVTYYDRNNQPITTAR